MQQLALNFDLAINAPGKPVVNIWPHICSFENLLNAYLKARKGKRQRDAIAAFELNREAELFTLQQELLSGTYQPGKYRQFQIYDRKPRTISAAPFRDRVVHHAIMNYLQPLLEPLLYEHCYACRVGFGVHRAVNQYEQWARRYTYVLKMDVQRYFPSVEQTVLLRQLADVINDEVLLDVLARIIHSYPSEEAGKGMAIGNLTSQFLANWYLRDIDTLISQHLGFKAYFRYVDDLFVFADNKAELWALKARIDEALVPLKLQLHQHKAVVCQTQEKVPVLGYQISRNKRWLQAANGKKAVKKINKQMKFLKEGKLNFKEVQASISAWVGHAQHGQTYGLRRNIFED